MSFKNLKPEGKHTFKVYSCVGPQTTISIMVSLGQGVAAANTRNRTILVFKL